MGWKQFYKISQENFKSMWERSEKWGDLIPVKATVDSTVYYGAGLITAPPPGRYDHGFSPKIQHPAGFNTRITVKLFFYSDANEPANSASNLHIVFYTDGDTAKDEQGYDAHGFSVLLRESPPSNIIVFYEFRVEQSGNKIVWYVDGEKIGEATLTGALQSFKLLITNFQYTAYSSGLQSGSHGIVIYEVVGEYYDQLEDIFNMMTQIMFIMMFIVIGIMFVRMIFKPIRGRE